MGPDVNDATTRAWPLGSAASLLIAAALILGACGSSDADGADPAPQGSETVDPAEASADPAPAETNGDGQTATVTIDGETIDFDLTEMCQNRQDNEMLALGRSLDGQWDFDLRYDRNEPDVETYEELLFSNEAERVGWMIRESSFEGTPDQFPAGDVTWTKDGSTITGEATFAAVFSDQEQQTAEGSFTITC